MQLIICVTNSQTIIVSHYLNVDQTFLNRQHCLLLLIIVEKTYARKCQIPTLLVLFFFILHESTYSNLLNFSAELRWQKKRGWRLLINITPSKTHCVVYNNTRELLLWDWVPPPTDIGIYTAHPLLIIGRFNFRILFRLSVYVNNICKQI